MIGSMGPPLISKLNFFDHALDHSDLIIFIKLINFKFNLNIKNYTELHVWSITNSENFWHELWSYLGLIGPQKPQRAIGKIKSLVDVEWFENVPFNYTENIFRELNDRTAILSVSKDLSYHETSFRQLHDKVCAMAAALEDFSNQPETICFGFVNNSEDAIVSVLAAQAKGMIWTALSSECSETYVIGRIEELNPTIIFASQKLMSRELRNKLKKYRIIFLDCDPEESIESASDRFADQIYKKYSNHKVINFVHRKFNAPAFLSFTSGTSGKPKKIFHSAGILINHLKELKFHIELKQKESLFFLTQPGWMMWVWSISALAIGTQLVVYDGHPFLPEKNIVLKILEKFKIHFFGSGATFYEELQRIYSSKENTFNFSNLKSFLSTGSRLPQQTYLYLNQISKKTRIIEMCGGTEISGSFFSGNPLKSQRPGWMQSITLGIDVYVVDQNNKIVFDEPGELVCRSILPCYPVPGPGNDEYEKLIDAYLKNDPLQWFHGDLAVISSDGYCKVTGRSDNIIKNRGIRIAPQDIYDVLSAFPAVKEYLFSLVQTENHSETVLFLTKNKNFELTEDLYIQIKKEIRTKLTSFHVPDVILPIEEILYTSNGKRAESLVNKYLGFKLTSDEALHVKNPENLVNFARPFLLSKLIDILSQQPNIQIDKKNISESTFLSGANSILGSIDLVYFLNDVEDYFLTNFGKKLNLLSLENFKIDKDYMLKLGNLVNLILAKGPISEN